MDVSGGGYAEAKVNPHRQTTLQLYQQIPGLQCFPNSVATARRVHVGVTTHSCTGISHPLSYTNNHQYSLTHSLSFIFCHTLYLYNDLSIYNEPPNTPNNTHIINTLSNTRTNLPYNH